MKTPILCGRKNLMWSLRFPPLDVRALYNSLPFSSCRTHEYDKIDIYLITLCYIGLCHFRLERDSPPGFKKSNLPCLKRSRI